MSRLVLFVSMGLLLDSAAAIGEQRMIRVGDRRVAVYCDGRAIASSPTVILIPAGGRTATDWKAVQPDVARFTRVCSYDHANFGASDRAPVKLQSVDEVVDDLNEWLVNSGEKPPFVLVSHSISGFYARTFASRYPNQTAGLVFVDSSHEEQALRLHELDPDGPTLTDLTERLGFYIQRGQKLAWQTSLPLIVLGRGTPFERKARDGSDSQSNRMTEEQWVAWDRTWRNFQQDLSKRSLRGQFRVAEKSGHWIQRDEPELVVNAVRDAARIAMTP